MNEKNPWIFIVGSAVGRGAFLGYLRNLTPQIVLATSCALLYLRGACGQATERLLWVAAVLAVVFLFAAVANALEFFAAMSGELSRRADQHKQRLNDLALAREDAEGWAISIDTKHKNDSQFLFLLRGERLLLIEALFVVFVPYLCFVAVLIIASGQVHSSALAHCN